jgi:hypothetical protein
MTLRSRGASRPKLCIDDTLEKQRVQGKPGAHDTRSRAHNNAHGRPQVRRNTRLSLRSGFNGLCRVLPGAEFLWPPSPTDWRLIESPVGPDNLHRLDTSNGCQDRAVLPSTASPDKALRSARMLPEEVLPEAFKRPSSARDVRSREDPPCEPIARPNAAASTATRPNVRDAGQRPSVSRTG